MDAAWNVNGKMTGKLFIGFSKSRSAMLNTVDRIFVNMHRVHRMVGPLAWYTQ
jgi:hypothetical protein